jgi:hypothetical protein
MFDHISVCLSSLGLFVQQSCSLLHVLTRMAWDYNQIGGSGVHAELPQVLVGADLHLELGSFLHAKSKELIERRCI